MTATTERSFQVGDGAEIVVSRKTLSTGGHVINIEAHGVSLGFTEAEARALHGVLGTMLPAPGFERTAEFHEKHQTEPKGESDAP